MAMVTAARHVSSLSLARALRVLALAAAALALPLGCGGDPAAPGAPAGCPTGSIAWTDGSCMAVGIQGCADLFIEEDGLCHPRMAKCPAGTIPKFDEGCVPVGIQGCAEMFMEEDGLCHPSMAKCPAGTIPKFDEGCAPVGIQGCAEVFMEDDGLCHPTMDKCPAGTFAVPQQGCLPIDGPDGCGSGTWGNLQEEPGVETIWVDPSVAASGDGSKANPVKTIAEALTGVPEGGRIALGTGTYDEPILITKAVTVEGRCPSMVRVQGTGAVDTLIYVVGVNAADNVTLRSLEIGGAGIGVLAQNATGLLIEGVHMRSATSSGLLLQGSTMEVSIAKSWIEGTLTGNDGTPGAGVQVTHGARATLAESAIVANREVGVLLGVSGTEVTMIDSLVEGTLPRESDGLTGRGIETVQGAKLTLSSSAVFMNHDSGVIAAGYATELTLTNSLVEGTLPEEATAAWGSGVTVQEGVGLTLLGTAILGNHTGGIVVLSTGTEATVTGSLVEGTLPRQSDGQFGRGVQVEMGAKLKLGESAIVKNYGIGLLVRDTGTEGTATGVLFEGQGGSGIASAAGAIATLEGGAVIANRAAGIFADEIGTQLTATSSLITGTLPEAGGGEFGVGVLVSGGALATLGSNAIVANRFTGLALQRAATHVKATGNLIAGTLPQESDSLLGRGVNVIEGATLVLDANAIVDNHDVGVLAGSPGTVLTSIGNLIEGTLEEVGSKRDGRGVSVQVYAQATLEANAIVANHGLGFFVSESSAVATSSIIEDTLPRESDGQLGIGVVSADGATLQLASSFLHNNQVSALQVTLATAAVSHCLIDVVAAGSFTLNNPTRQFDNIGDGLLATFGSTLGITDTRIQGSVRAGLLFDDSSGTLSGVVSTGNQFGLVLQGDRRPSYEGGNNHLTGNTAQDIVTGGDLPVPDAPSPVPPSE